MGWDFTQGATRTDIIIRRVQSWNSESAYHECLAYSTSGNTLWTVWQICSKDPNQPAYRFIGCDLLSSHKGYGWGYKDMAESQHPFHYACPLAYLEMVKAEAPNSFCLEWREGVRAYWASHAEQKGKVQGLQVGQTITLNGCKISNVTILSLRPLIGVWQGRKYRIPRKLIA